METHITKVGETVKMFDYANDIIDETVVISNIDYYSQTITYKRENGKEVDFSGQGYYEIIN